MSDLDALTQPVPRRALTLALWAAVGLGAASLLALAVCAIFIRQDISSPESMVPWAAAEFAAGRPLYSDWREWPHRFMPYGPLLCAPVGLVMRAMGLDHPDFVAYLLGRGQSLLYLLGCCWVAAGTLVRFGWSRAAALVCSLAYAALWSGTIVPMLSFRPDLPALFWVLLAVDFAYGRPYMRRNAALALAAFGMSVLYKPAYLAFPASYCLWLWWRRDFRTGALWGAALVAGLVVYAALGNVLTDGRFLLNQVGASSMGLTTEFYGIAWQMLLEPAGLPVLWWDWVARLLLTLVAAAWVLKRRGDQDSREGRRRGLALYFLVALVMNLVMLFKVGAGPNYLLESWAVGGLLLAIAARDILRLEKADGQSRWKTATEITVVLVFVGPLLMAAYLNFRDVPKAIRYAQATPAQSRLMALPATALMTDLAFAHPAAEVHALSDPVPYVFLSGKGRISPEPLRQRLAARAFSHITLSPGVKYLFFAKDRAPWIGQALDENYRLEETWPEYELWLPKDSSPPRT